MANRPRRRFDSSRSRNLETIQAEFAEGENGSISADGVDSERPAACFEEQLLQIPECGVGLQQFESGIPGLVAAPHHLGFRVAARFGVNQPHSPV